MRLTWISGLLFLILFASTRFIDSQTGTPAPYHLNVAVDEVSLTFHAEDIHGLAITDLKPDELRILDNDKPPHRIVLFESLKDLPIRAGILMDTSQSMQQNAASDHAIAIEYAQRILRQQTDRAFVMRFGKQSTVLQSWTNNPTVLTAGIDRVGEGFGGTTALFDTLYATCRYQFGSQHVASGNFILLFSDGEDDASYLTLKNAVDMCQHTNTAIYAFRAEQSPGSTTDGLRNLAELVRQTGGRLFHDDDSQSEIVDLRAIESDLRNQYHLIYNPATLQHDGVFHRITLLGPDRVNRITVRSGYYAPSR
ncbi:MAG TPA: VWA domain-containing protein [Edaphobacter sp.]|jgi:Ca-activated chloride channel family protein|nr:VWA domain-containing protein [Edaphobacter sp.]